MKRLRYSDEHLIRRPVFYTAGTALTMPEPLSSTLFQHPPRLITVTRNTQSDTDRSLIPPVMRPKVQCKSSTGLRRGSPRKAQKEVSHPQAVQPATPTRRQTFSWPTEVGY